MNEVEKAMKRFLPVKRTPEEQAEHERLYNIERDIYLATFLECEKCHHRYPPDIVINGKCKQCIKAEKLEADEIRRNHEEVEKRKELFKLEIPKRYNTYTFNDYIPSEESAKSVNIVKRYAESDKVIDNGSNLVLSGSVGTGKTMLAICVLRERFLKGDAIHYTTISKLITTSRHSMSYGGNKRDMNIFYKTKHLVIDEIGRQSGSDNELNILFEILNERYNNVLPTILITNKSGKDIQQFLGKALIDRMNEVNTMFLDMSWKSYRVSG